MKNKLPVKIQESAFTLIELLVVISIIALLMGILMPALFRAREQGRKTICANNLKQINTSLRLYAVDNDGRLPLNRAGYWLWDIAYTTTDLIINSGGSRDTFYCPCDTSKNGDMAVVWNYGQNVPSYNTRPEEMEEPTSNRGGMYRVTSYFWMMDTQYGRRENPIGTPPKKWVRTIDMAGASNLDLIVDATLSTGTDPATASFTEITMGGLYSRWGLFDRTNHVGKSGRPEGGNVVYLDGHQEWRPFSEMVVRLTQDPTHWW